MLNLYRRSGGLFKPLIPVPLKIFGGIAAVAAAGVFLTPPLLLLATPPLVLGWFVWRSRAMRMARFLHDKRWQELASYHLQLSNSAHDSRLQYQARSRIQRAIDNNEQQLRHRLGVVEGTSVDFGPLESMYQDFKGSSGGFTESIECKEYPLLLNGTRRATVRLISKKGKARIEIQIGRDIIVLEQEDVEDQIIDVK